MIRSAKRNAITPPNEIPPCHSAAARGTLPMEQTKLMIAMNGPTNAFSMLVQTPCPLMNTACQTDVGTRTARKPATTYPMTSSRRTMVRSAIVYVALSAHLAGDRRPVRRDAGSVASPCGASISGAWSCSLPCPPASAASRRARASTTSFPRSHRAPSVARRKIMMMPPTNSLTANCHPRRTINTMPSSITRLVDANMKTIAAM